MTRAKFDEIINRRGTECYKWDKLNELYGKDDVIAMWVADMDIPVAEPILNAVKKRMEHEVFGYSFLDNSYYEAVIGWMKRRHDWEIEKEWINYTPGVVPALNFLVRALSNPGDEVIVQTPVYNPFMDSIRNNGRRVVENSLIFKDDTYVMDYEDLESKISDRTRLLILCNPHNPVGRVWSKEELKQLGDICLKHNIIVISDEIHSDIIYKGYKHNVFANICDEFKQNCVICTAPSKSFNIAGFKVSNIIIPNENIRKKFKIEIENNHIENPAVFTSAVLKASYNECESWFDELMEYLEENKNYAIDYFKENIPHIRIVKPEGTYLLWVDCSDLKLNNKELKEFFTKKCGVALGEGCKYGDGGNSFQRINIGCSKEVLEEGLKRIETGVKELVSNMN